ncbi:MAG: ATP-binding protein, partial [Planctomycetota bacterium]
MAKVRKTRVKSKHKAAGKARSASKKTTSKRKKAGKKAAKKVAGKRAGKALRVSKKTKPKAEEVLEESPEQANGLHSTAEDMARRQREISVAEFFMKNRHLLGFDNPRKALLTTIKEGVDNSLDACEEAGILPEVRIAIASGAEENRFRVTLEDNGPGILRKQIPKIFAKLLYGSKFHRLKMSRGQQGIGISAAGMYGQLTTGKPVIITSKTSRNQPAHHYELEIDAKKNEPRILV